MDAAGTRNTQNQKMQVMKTTDKIILFLERQSRGVINLTQSDAQHIIDIVLQNAVNVEGKAFVKISRWNAVSSTWELIHTKTTTTEAIQVQINEALTKTPTMEFYMYECYNSAMEFEGKIFSASPTLFSNAA